VKIKSGWQKDLLSRTAINSVAIVIVATLLFLAYIAFWQWIFVGFFSLIAALVVWEYYQIVKKIDLYPALTLGMSSTILYIFSIFLKVHWGGNWVALPALLLGLALFGFFIHFAFSGQSPIVNIATSFFGLIYIAVPWGLLLEIMYVSPEGIWWVIYLIAVTKSADIGGYFIGRYFGRRKLASTLSPKKTYAGAVGGLIASLVMSCAIAALGKYFSVFASFHYVAALLLGLCLGIVGQIGDLAESLLKRDAQVKDSNKIPGVGGLLDMVDSLLFNIPVVYLFLRFFYDYHY